MSEQNNEGIAGIKKIKFDFEFTYAKDGDEDIGDTIVVKEPSFDDLETHARMTSLVTKGLFGAMPVMKGMIDASEEPNNEGAKEAVEDQQQRSAMFIMALGMDDKKYIEFIRFVKNLLTNDSRYAYVYGEQIGISDLLWKNIEEQGGKAAVEQILAEFVGFFIEAMDGKKAA